MKIPSPLLFSPGFVLVFGSLVGLQAQEAPQITGFDRLINGEVRLELSGTAGVHYRIETTTNLPSWNSLVTYRGTGSDQHTDTGAPYRGARYYRALRLEGADILTGDHLVTDEGEVVIHPVNHASFVMQWNGMMIYNDPVGGATPYASFSKADLILVSHSHGDHYSASTLDAVRGPNVIIIAPQAVYNSMSTTLKGLTKVLTYGATTNVLGVSVTAVPAYNSNHSYGSGNGFVVTIGGRRLYMSGDTGDVAEMRALREIDVAFVCMNVPYTMTVAQAVSAVREFQPKVVYPYHFRNQDGTLANLASFKTQVGADLGIEVRIRTWY